MSERNRQGTNPPPEVLVEIPGLSIRRAAKGRAIVPYPGRVRSNGTQIFEWVDLRRQPTLIAEIPEAKHSVGMQKLLSIANQADAGLITTGCDSGARVTNDKAGAPEFVAGGFVMLTFVSDEGNSSPDQLFDLAQAIRLNIKPPADWVCCRFCLDIEPYRSFFGNDDRFGLALEVVGSGESPELAAASFDAATHLLAAALASVIAGYAKGTGNG